MDPRPRVRKLTPQSRLTQQLHSYWNERQENQERGQSHGPGSILSPSDGVEGVQENQNEEGVGHPFPTHFSAALLKRRVEEALTFKGLLKLGKTSNKEISCHMRVVRKTGIQSYNFAS